MEQYGKRIRVFKNGDGYFTGKKMLISPIYCRIYEQVSGNDYMHLSECMYLWVARMYLCYTLRIYVIRCVSMPSMRINAMICCYTYILSTCYLCACVYIMSV
jgi:hypothetical protein